MKRLVLFCLLGAFFLILCAPLKLYAESLNPLPTCGNGMIDAGEECDDRNTDNSDDCLSTCQLPFCGDTQCRPEENCDTCAIDCGECAIGENTGDHPPSDNPDNATITDAGSNYTVEESGGGGCALEPGIMAPSIEPFFLLGGWAVFVLGRRKMKLKKD